MADHEGIDLRGKNVVLVGRMKTMSSTVMRQHISRLGGVNRNTPRSTTHVFVVSDAGGEKVQRVITRFGGTKAILSEAEFADALAALEAPSEEPVPLEDALGELRSAFDGTPDADAWRVVIESLDACPEAQREAATRYVESHTSRWPDPWDAPEAPLPPGRDPELCRPPSSWWLRMLDGERSPEFGLLRALTFRYKSVNGTMGSKIVTHPDLVNLRSLNLGAGNKLSKTFFKTLRTSPVMSNLEALHLFALDSSRAAELCGDHDLGSLKHVYMRKSGVFMSDAPWDALFEATWWGRVEGLFFDDLDDFYQRGVSLNEGFQQALVENIGALEGLRHVRVGAPDASRVLGSDGLLDRVARVSVDVVTRPNIAALAARLARPHVLSVLDVIGSQRRGYQRVPDAPEAVFELLGDPELLRGLSEVRVSAEGATDNQRLAMASAAEDAGAALTWVVSPGSESRPG